MNLETEGRGADDVGSWLDALVLTERDVAWARDCWPQAAPGSEPRSDAISHRVALPTPEDQQGDFASPGGPLAAGPQADWSPPFQGENERPWREPGRCAICLVDPVHTEEPRCPIQRPSPTIATWF